MARRGESDSTVAARWRLLAGSCVAALTALSQPALAADASAAKADQLGEVTVTARFVTENVQTTPMAITTQTTQQLQAANVTTLSTLGAVVPNLWTLPGDSQSAGTPRISMRGIQQGASSSLAVPPAVAIYTDDVYQATTAGSEIDLTDIDHIEVNRGPQSTLSGNASIGGSIKIVSKDPTGDGSGYVGVEAGSRNKLGVNGAFDMALAPTLSMRLSGNFERQDGFVSRLDFTCEMVKLGTPALAGSFPAQPNSASSNCVTGHLGGTNHLTVQGKLRWQPTDKLDFVLTGRSHREDDEETPETAIAYQPNPLANTNTLTQGFNNATQASYGIQLDSRFLTPASYKGYAVYSTDCRPLYASQPNTAATPSGFCYPQSKPEHRNTLSIKGHYQWTDKVGVTAIAAYTEYGNAFTQNGDQSPLGYVVSHFENHANQYTGELRFDGKLFADKLNWVAGGFVMRVKGFQNTFAGVDFGGTSYANDSAAISSQSGFFHLDYNITDRWRISGGGRYTNGAIDFTFNHPGSLVVPAPLGSKQNRFDWLVSTDYKLTDNILLYANAASGSRPPGVTTIVSTPAQLLPTPAEDLISYEGGIKAEWFGHKLRTNLSGFYTDYKLLAATQGGFECVGQPGTHTWFVANSSCSQFANAGFLIWNLPVGIPAKVSGFEWDVTALPMDHLRIDFTGGYNHFTSGVKTVGAPGYLFPGNHRQPEWNMHADVSYDIGTPIGNFTPRLDWSWQSQQDFDPSNNIRAPLAIYIIHPYSLLNAQIAYTPENSPWSATFRVENMANLYYYYMVIQGSLDAQTRVAPPREVSFSVRRTF